MNQNELTKTYKGLYPFRLGTTSFIYPDLYTENVKKLGNYVDEIELLFFESKDPGMLPDDYELNALSELKNELDITYNVHLPTDIIFVTANPNYRKEAIDNIIRVMNATAVLDPVSYTLHLPYEDHFGGATMWQDYAYKGLSMLLENDVDPSMISIETLDYSPVLLSEVADKFDLSICLDIGHLLLQGYDPLKTFNKFKEKTTMIHLHGVQNGCDHMSLDHLSEDVWGSVREILKDYTGSLSIEVFSFDDLKKSVNAFERWIEPSFFIQSV